MEIIRDKLIQGLRLLTSPTIFVVSIVFCIALALASPFIAMTLGFWDFGASTDEITIQREQVSPNGGFVARYFTISGGGAAGYVSQRVNVQKAASEFNQSDGIILELAHSQIHSIDWESDNLLKVRYSKTGTVYSRKARLDGETPIEVEFTEY
jgi:hypothetical protein